MNCSILVVALLGSRWQCVMLALNTLTLALQVLRKAAMSSFIVQCLSFTMFITNIKMTVPYLFVTFTD